MENVPQYVLSCLEALEQEGFAAYMVGGCVRDACLGLIPHDYDICTAALPEQTEAVFAGRKLGLDGKKHGTIVVHTEGGEVEITTFRTEGDYQDNRHPDWVEFVPEVEQDLARRDYTVNAMAWSPFRGFADPFGGRQDLEKGILRAVGNPGKRYREDALRILRGIRFAARFGLTLEPETLQAMECHAHLLDNLARERVFAELSEFLRFAGLEDLLRFAPVLASAIPELKPMIGFDQHSPHHAYDLYTHTAHVTAGVSGDLVRRWAALLHDTGKVTTFTQDKNGRGHFYGHAPESAKIADVILLRLKAPTDLRQQAVFLIDQHMTGLEADKPFLRRLLSRYGWEAVSDLLALQWADFLGKGKGEEGPDFDRIDDLLTEISEENPCLSLKDLALKGGDLMALGCSGKEIGAKLNALLELVLDGKTENTRTALLEALARMK